MTALAIVGSGLAGRSAAIAAAQAGIDVHLFDRFSIDPDLRQAQITVYSDTPVWGLFPAWSVAASRGTEPVIVDVDVVLLANGSIDKTIPLAGSTKPGVITASGLAQLIDRWKLLPGNRFVVIGDGMEADQSVELIQQSGGEVESIEPSSSARSLQVIGETFITGVRHGNTSIEADIVVLAAGTLPDLTLAAMAGCDMHFDDASNHWRLSVSDQGQTSIPTIWAAGSVVGAEDAEASGKRAAESIAAMIASGNVEQPTPSRSTIVRQPWRFDERIGGSAR